MLSICGLDCCSECNKKNDCDGCVKTDGHPFGGTCVAAECVRREGLEGLKKMKEMLIEEFHALGIQSLQVEIPGSDRCYGIVADDKYLLVCEYGCNGTEPQIIIYKKR